MRAAYFIPKPHWDGDAFFTAVKIFFESLFDDANGNYQFKEDYFRARLGDWRSATITTSKQTLDPGLFTKKEKAVMLWGTGLVHAINLMLQFPVHNAAGLDVPKPKNPSKCERKSAKPHVELPSIDDDKSSLKKSKSDLSRTETTDNLRLDYDSAAEKAEVERLEKQLTQVRRDNERKYGELRAKFAVVKRSKPDNVELQNQRLSFWSQRVVDLESELRLSERKGSALDEQLKKKF